jgi:hypothetical protein
VIGQRRPGRVDAAAIEGWQNSLSPHGNILAGAPSSPHRSGATISPLTLFMIAEQFERSGHARTDRHTAAGSSDPRGNGLDHCLDRAVGHPDAVDVESNSRGFTGFIRPSA